MARLSGTPKRLTFDGTVFDVPTDANFTINPDSVIEGQATSGKTMYKVTKQVMTVEGATVSADSADYELLLSLHRKGASGVNYPLSYTKADGSVYRSTGKINLESHETETNIATMSLIPEDLWQPFIV
jgi:hypothetical protein